MDYKNFTIIVLKNVFNGYFNNSLHQLTLG